MPKSILRHLFVVVLAFYFGHSTAVLEPQRAYGDDQAGRHLFPPRRASTTTTAEPASQRGGWWLATVGAALALAVVGGLSIASRRFAPAAQPGAPGLRVIGRTSLSPRHAVFLVRAGNRVLVLGTGPQGPPSLLGELDDEPEQGPLPRPQLSRGGAA